MKTRGNVAISEVPRKSSNPEGVPMLGVQYVGKLGPATAVRNRVAVVDHE